MKKIIIILSVITGVWLAACHKEKSDFENAKTELDQLINYTIQFQSNAVKLITSSTNPEEILLTIRQVITTKQAIDPGIDQIARKYPDLNDREIEKIKSFMSEKAHQLIISSADFEKSVDGAIRQYKDDQNVSKPLILALKDYQMLGQ